MPYLCLVTNGLGVKADRHTFTEEEEADINTPQHCWSGSATRKRKEYRQRAHPIRIVHMGGVVSEHMTLVRCCENHEKAR